VRGGHILEARSGGGSELRGTLHAVEERRHSITIHRSIRTERTIRPAGRNTAGPHPPNPPQGGTFTNKVIQTAAKALSQLGFHCYLPNLRGVGNSEGTHDYGRGETQDCIAVIDYARAQHPEAELFALAGFSFGGYVATFAAQG